MLPKILIIEDTRLFYNCINHELISSHKFQGVHAATYHEACDLINSGEHNFFGALVDLNLPDAPEGKALDLTLEHNIPSIVFTGYFNNQIRTRIQRKDIVDYIVKSGKEDICNIVTIFERLLNNANKKILVVDDSEVSRNYIKSLLERQNFKTYIAASAKEALNILDKIPGINLLITDYEMPDMNGEQLIKKVRRKHFKDDLAIIGISAKKAEFLSAKMLKSGANDFLVKPFLNEELYCRINQNLEMLDLVNKIKEISNTDFLTNLHNRRSFFNIAKKKMHNCLAAGRDFSIAMIDADHFKAVNDNYGHDVGDYVLQQLANTLKEAIGQDDIIARIGGEEFALFLENTTQENAKHLLDSIKDEIEDFNYEFDQTFNITISAGICSEGDTLEEVIKKADAALYVAKRTGRNKVVIAKENS